MIRQITQRWSALSVREQQFLRWGGLLATAILLMMSLLPAVQQLQEQKRDHAELLAQRAWLQKESGAILRWQQQYAGAPLGLLSSPRAAGALLHEGLSRYRLQGKVSGGDILRVDIDRGDGDRVLAYLEAVVGAGLLLQQVTLKPHEAHPGVQAQLTFRVLP